MAFLLILTGARAGELIELDPAATLTLGSGDDAHVPLRDPEVADAHCQLYVAEGQPCLYDLGHALTYLNMAPITKEARVLTAHDIVVIGRTYLTFLPELPEWASGAPDAGLEERLLEASRLAEEHAKAMATQDEHLREASDVADERAGVIATLEEAAITHAEALEAMTQRAEAAEAELIAVRADGWNEDETAQEAPLEVLDELRLRLETVQAELISARADADEARASLTKTGLERDRVTVERDTAKKGLERARRELGEAKNELREARAGAQRAGAADAEAAQTREALDEATAALEASRAALEEARAQQQASESERAEESAQLREARDSAEDARRAARAGWDASRAALAALGIGDAPDGLPEAAPDDVGALLSASGLAPEEAARLRASLTEHVDRESLRRAAGAPPRFETSAESDARLLELRRIASALADRAAHIRQGNTD